MIRETAYKDFAEGAVGNKELLSSVQTTDATVTTLQLITVPDNSRGFMIITMMAVTPVVSTNGLIGRKIIHWKSAAAAATMLAAVNIVADNLEGLATATWTVDASGLDLRIRVTGEAAITLDWYALYDNNYIELTPP